MASEEPRGSGRVSWGGIFGRNSRAKDSSDEKPGPSKWSMGVMNDPETVEVPGSVLLLAAHRNEPLGLRNVHARTSHASIPAGFAVETPMTPGGTRPLPGSSTPPSNSSHGPALKSAEEAEDKKKTDDGTIILEPQPDDSANDPLNWPSWRRDIALLTLGIYCMIGGGITPLIAAGFTDVASTYNVSIDRVPLTTGLYMMGLGVGSVIFSPTAILFGKRPVYLGSAILFVGTSLWAGWSPNFNSLLVARVFQGIAVSPVECLPSATIAEIFFLHERAYRIGIYTLLLLSGKNLVPLVSAAIIGRFGWRWVFWIVAMVVGLGFVLLFFFVPETFWDRTPTRKPAKRPSFLRRLSSRHGHQTPRQSNPTASGGSGPGEPISPAAADRQKDLHVGFAPDMSEHDRPQSSIPVSTSAEEHQTVPVPEATHRRGSATPDLAATNSPYLHSATGSAANVDYFTQGPNLDNEKIPASALRALPKSQAYTHNLRQQPPKSFKQHLKIWHGRLNNDKWHKVMIRPFILALYPAVAWSSVVYACSIGWLIVISECVAVIYRNADTYNFSALQTGLVYISPFVGGVLGTGVAGKVSDIIVRAMSRRNGGLYEPEFRLVMAIPIVLTTCIGLMGFGWSAQDRDNWIVPTIFFGVISFGCSLGSTTSITFCVDSYRQYAGEALVTLNFTKNVCHGLVFSLFFANWLADEGSKTVFIWLGVIQLCVLLCTIPMYIFGKRARMWTTRKNLMEKF